MTGSALLDVLLAVLGGAVRVGTPFLFVSLGECLTEKAGRINLGLEGVLVLSAMAAFAGAYLGDSAWIGVLCGALAGGLLAALHGVLCSLPRVNDVATGIALHRRAQGDLAGHRDRRPAASLPCVARERRVWLRPVCGVLRGGLGAQVLPCDGAPPGG